MTLFFESHQIQIYRQKRKAGTNRFGMSATGTVHPADIQPADQQRIEMTEGRYGKTHVGYVEVTVDVKEGDQVEANGKRYSVKGVSTWEDAGMLDSKEIILVSQDG